MECTKDKGSCKSRSFFYCQRSFRCYVSAVAPEIIKKTSTTQLSMNIFLLLNIVKMPTIVVVKMPTIVGI